MSLDDWNVNTNVHCPISWEEFVANMDALLNAVSEGEKRHTMRLLSAFPSDAANSIVNSMEDWYKEVTERFKEYKQQLLYSEGDLYKHGHDACGRYSAMLGFSSTGYNFPWSAVGCELCSLSSFITLQP